MQIDPITVTLVAIIASIFGICLWIFFFRIPIFLITITLVVLIINMIFTQSLLSLEIGQYNVYVLDILAIYLLSIAVVNIIVFRKHKNKEIILIIFLGILLLVSWLRGVLSFGLESSTNDLRTYLYFFSTLLYMCSLPYSARLLRKVSISFTLAGWILLIIAIVRWILVSLNIIASSAWQAPNGWMIRVLPAAAALLILQTILIARISSESQKRFFMVIKNLLIVAVVILLLHRTVWVVMIMIGILAIVIKTKNKILVYLGIFSMIAFSGLLLLGSDLSSLNLSGSTLDLSSFMWRIKGWLALVSTDRYQTPLDYIIGQPFGTGYVRYITDATYATTVGPHNFFVQTFLNIGGLGLALILVLYISTIRSLFVNSKNRIMLSFILLLFSQLVYSITYTPSFEQGFILGLAILIIRASSDSLRRKNMAIINTESNNIELE